MNHLDVAITRGDFLWALHSICQLHHIPFNANLLLQQFPPPYNLAVLENAAASLGFNTQTQRMSSVELSNITLPCLVMLHPLHMDEAMLAPETQIATHPLTDKANPALLVQTDTERVLFFEPASHGPVTLSLSEFAMRYTGTVVLFSLNSTEVNDEDSVKKKSSFGFGWFGPELLKHKKIWRDVLIASLVIQLMALATPLFTQAIIDKVVVHHTTSTLAVISIALAVFMLFNAIMGWVRQYLLLHTGNRVDAVLGTQVFEHLLKLPVRYFEHRPTGTLVARLHGVETIREFISGAAVSLILDFPFLLIFIGIMFYYSVTLSLVALSILSVIVCLSAAVTPILRKRLNQQFLMGARNQAFLTEYVAGMETVKSLQMEPQLKGKFGEYFSSYLDASFKTRQLSNTYNVFTGMLEQLMTLSILCAGAWVVMHDPAFSIGMLVAFQMFASRVSQPMLRLAGLWQEFQQAGIAVKRLGDIMDAPSEPYSVVPVRSQEALGQIEMQGISFRYSEERPYLYRNLNLTLKPGLCMALMGPSGSGKSTLAKLLQGFYQPNDGTIQIDGLDIRYLSANELRQHFGVVPQETRLFSGTIFDNLILANPHATFDQVMQACKLAEIHDNIEKLPEGYQTEIGEQGVGLSGGQKQRLAIARALLKQPKVLIFDEATSSLDHHTAEQFAKTINRLKGKVTMLFITHQLPKGLAVDEVVALGANANEQEKHISVVKGSKEAEGHYDIS